MHDHSIQPVSTPNGVHLNTHFQRPDKLTDKLYVITTIFNNARYRTRWKHYGDFARMINNHPSVELWTVELAFGDREFAITQHDNPHHLQLRTNTEIWHKERLINLVAQRLPHDWNKVALVDADVFSVRPDWFDETKHALEHYDVVQMWSQAQDLGPNNETIQEHRSLVDCYQAGMPIDNTNIHGYYTKSHGIVYWHPGYAWAWRRSAWDAVGGMFDTAILGSADFHMAHALIGNVKSTLSNGMHKDYKRAICEWEERALTLKCNIGVVRGCIYHAWHGAKVSRQYTTRWKILENHQFLPSTDLTLDWQGLYKLSHKTSHKLRDAVRNYFYQRNEDSTCPYGH